LFAEPIVVTIVKHDTTAVGIDGRAVGIIPSLTRTNALGVEGTKALTPSRKGEKSENLYHGG
jgi:hypothetical protein